MLAAANQTSDSVSMFSVGPSGALTSVSGSPFTLGAQPGSVIFSPSGKLLEVTAGESLYIFSVSASGALTQAPGSPHSVKGLGHVAFSPSGGLLAVLDSAGVSMFSVNASGVLAEVPGSPLDSAGAPEGNAVYGNAVFSDGGNVLRVAEWLASVSDVVTTYSVA